MPEVGPFEWYVDCFRELSTSRQQGFGPAPIPFSSIREYATIYVDEQDFDEFLYVMRQMDNAYLEASDSGNKSNGPGSGKKNTDKN